MDNITNKEYIYRSDDCLLKVGVHGMHGHGHDMFGIPLQFASQFWGKDDVRGEIADHLQKNEFTNAESNFFNCIVRQINEGVCFTSLEEAAAKMDNKYKWFVCMKFNLAFNRRESAHDFFVLDNESVPFIFGEQKYVRVLASISARKMFLSNPYGDLQKSKYSTLDIWGNLTINRGEDRIQSFRVKPIVAGLNWISDFENYLSQS